MIQSKIKIRGKLTLLLLVFGMVPVIAVTPVVMSKLDDMQQITLDGQETTASDIIETIDRNLFERYGDVQAFGLNAAVQNPANWRNQSEGNPLVSAMDGYMANYGIYKLMMVVGLDGQVLAVNSKDAEGKSLSTSAIYQKSFKESSWFQKAIKGEFLKGKKLTGTVVENPRYESLVADMYKEDGFVITFAAPVKDEHGKTIAIWVNFADFGLVEGIVQSFYEQKKSIGMGYAAFGIEDAEGVSLVNFDPEDMKEGETYKRDSNAIGKKSLESLQVPASKQALQIANGTEMQLDTQSGETDAVGWAKSNGAYDYPGLGWAVIMHTPAEEAFASVYKAKTLLFTMIGGAAVLIVGFGVLLGTLASKPLRRFASTMKSISDGDYTVTAAGAERSDELGSLAQAMNGLKGSLDGNTRLRMGLDSVTSNVMMADENLNIIYLNDSVISMLQEAEKDIQKDLPRFSVANLMGANIDIFHKNPAHQRGMLDKMAVPTKTSIVVGGRSYNLNAVPLFNQNKERIGTVVEWLDGAAAGMVEAINKSQAVISFQPDGTIVNANANFLSVMGYSMDEIKGKHHSMFADAAYKASDEYKRFWEELARGEAQTGEFKRFAKGGKEIWINGSYNPILDLKGKVVRVVKTATDITKQRLMNADYSGQIDAIGKSQAVISFNMDGTIIEANYNFLTTLGYSMDEIKGKHHSIFVDPVYKNSNEYKQFWDNLGRGEYQAGEYKRFGKGGKEVWIQASYNPIMDLNGKAFKVVKYATDVTQMVMTRMENERGSNETMEVLDGLSKGDLSVTMTGEYNGTFVPIQNNLNATIIRLRDIVMRIKESAQSVSSASNEISAGSNDLSQRTEQQASSLEETAASMEQITGTVRANSENAKNANQLSAEARDVAGNGGKVVSDAVAAMGNIEKSSQKISDIISVIDEIAFQTNLLALNAAVEAARAGEAGKGFAVVASEVRSLAGRSASASKEIKALINESSQQVKSGAALVNQAGDTLKDIVSSVKKVADIIAEISNASQEQATGIDEINSAVSQMDEATQQNAALVEENTAAAQSLVNQAQELDKMMQFFKIDEELQATDAHQAAEMRSSSPSLVVVKSVVKKPVKPSVMRPVAKSDVKKVASKGGTSDREWEEF